MDEFKINIKLHNPPFIYFSTIYITLVTIVQGIVFTEIISLAIDFLNPKENEPAVALRLFECLNAMVVVLIIWHKYVNHHQITGWQVTVRDTSILFGFGIIEGFMIASLKYSEGIGRLPVHFWIAFLCLFTVYAYWHAWSQLKEDYVKDIFLKYYAKYLSKIFRIY